MIVEDGILKRMDLPVSFNGIITVPEGVETVGGLKVENDFGRFGRDIFYQIFSLPGRVTEIRLPNSVQQIGDKAFKDCKNLKAIPHRKHLSKIAEI